VRRGALVLLRQYSSDLLTVVLLKSGRHTGRIAVIVEIIDHNRVRGSMSYTSSVLTRVLQAIIDGPTTGVPRQAFPYRHLTLTPHTVPKLPRGAGSGTVKKYVDKGWRLLTSGSRQGGQRSVLLQTSGERSATLSVSKSCYTKSRDAIRCGRCSRPPRHEFSGAKRRVWCSLAPLAYPHVLIWWEWSSVCHT